MLLLRVALAAALAVSLARACCTPSSGPEFGCPLAGCRSPDKPLGTFTRCQEYEELSCCTAEDDCDVADFLLVEIASHYHTEQCREAFRTLECGYRCHPRQKSFVRRSSVDDVSILTVCASFCSHLWQACAASTFTNSSATTADDAAALLAAAPSVADVFGSEANFCREHAFGRADVVVEVSESNTDCFSGSIDLASEYSYASSFKSSLVGDETSFLVHVFSDLGVMQGGRADAIDVTFGGDATVDDDDVRITDNADGTYLVFYTGTSPGTLSITPMLDGMPVRGAPYTVYVAERSTCSLSLTESAAATPPLSMCSWYNDNACCDRTVTDELASSTWWDGIRAVYGSHPQCARNFEELLCGLRCAPSQGGTFTRKDGPPVGNDTVVPTPHESGIPIVDPIGVPGTWAVCDSFCCDLYDSCKDVVLMSGLTVETTYQSPLAFCLANNPWEREVRLEVVAPETYNGECFGAHGRGGAPYGPATHWVDGDTCVIAGADSSLTVQTADARLTPLDRGGQSIHLGDIMATFFRTDGAFAPFSPTVVDNRDGTYDVRYALETATEWAASMFVVPEVGSVAGLERVSNTPFPIEVRPGAACAAATRVPDMEMSVPVGRTSHFGIEAFDCYGNRVHHGGDDFSVTITGPEFTETKVTDNCDGTYDVSYTPLAPGDYTLLLNLTDINIKNETIVVGARGTDLPSSLSIAFGEGVSGVVLPLRAATDFTIVTIDGAGNVLSRVGQSDFNKTDIFTVLLVDDRGQSVHAPIELTARNGMIENEDNGRFGVDYVAEWTGTEFDPVNRPGIGRFWVYVLIGDENIQGSPFEMFVDRNQGATACRCGAHGRCVPSVGAQLACECFTDDCGIESWGQSQPDVPNSPCDLPPPITICDVRFRNESATALEVTLNQPTDRGTNRLGEPLLGQFACSELLADTGDGLDALLGADGSFCAFLAGDASSFNAFLGSAANAAIGDELYLRTTADGLGILRSAMVSTVSNALDNSADSTSEEVADKRDAARIVSPPDYFPRPTVMISAPSNVGACSDLVLDASRSTGSGGRPMWWHWDVEGDSDELANIRIFLAPQNTSIATVPHTELRVETQYTFTAVATNHFGVSSEVVRHTMTMTRLALPSLWVSPGHYRARATTDLLLHAELRTSPCQPDDATEPLTDPASHYTYTWVRVSGPLVDIDEDTTNTQDLFVPAGALQSGFTYVFEVRAQNTMLDFLRAEARAVVEVYYESPVAVLDGQTTERSHTLNPAPLALDGRLSTTRDSPLDQRVAYEWQCYKRSGRVGPLSDRFPQPRSLCYPDDDERLQHLPPLPLVELQAGAVGLGTYDFEMRVTATDLSSRPVAMRTEAVNTGSDGPATTIESYQVRANKFASYNDDMVLLARVSPDIDADWTVDAPPELEDLPAHFNNSITDSQKPGIASEVFAYTWVSLTGNLRINSDRTSGVVPGEATYLNSRDLYIPAKTLASGEYYKLRLVTLTPELEVGIAEIEFWSNPMPASGHCKLTPTGEFVDSDPRVFAYTTRFEVRCEQWEDNFSDQPPMFRFLVERNGVEVALTSSTTFRNHINFELPSGRSNVIAEIIDAEGAKQRFHMLVDVPQIEQNPDAGIDPLRLELQSTETEQRRRRRRRKRDVEQAGDGDLDFACADIGIPEEATTTTSGEVIARLVRPTIDNAVATSSGESMVQGVFTSADALNSFPTETAVPEVGIAFRTCERTYLLESLINDFQSSNSPEVLAARVGLIRQIVEVPAEVSLDSATLAINELARIAAQRPSVHLERAATPEAFYSAVALLLEAKGDNITQADSTAVLSAVTNFNQVLTASLTPGGQRVTFGGSGMVVRAYRGPVSTFATRNSRISGARSQFDVSDSYDGLAAAGFSVIAYTVTEFERNLFGAHSSAEGTVSSLSMLSLYDAVGHNLTVNEEFELRFTGEFSDARNLTCQYWDTTFQMFSDRGCRVTSLDDESVGCTCQTLGATAGGFVVIQDPAAVGATNYIPSGPFDSEQLPELTVVPTGRWLETHQLVLIILTAASAALLLLLAAFRYRPKRPRLTARDREAMAIRDAVLAARMDIIPRFFGAISDSDDDFFNFARRRNARGDDSSDYGSESNYSGSEDSEERERRRQARQSTRLMRMQAADVDSDEDDDGYGRLGEANNRQWQARYANTRTHRNAYGSERDGFDDMDEDPRKLRPRASVRAIDDAPPGRMTRYAPHVDRRMRPTAATATSRTAVDIDDYSDY